MPPSSEHQLPEDISALLDHGAKVASLADAHTFGIEESRLRHLCHAGLLTRVATGVYVSTAELDDADTWEALRMRGKAYVLSRSPGVFLVEEAAAALLGLRTVGQAPKRPVIATEYGQTNRTSTFGTVRRVALASEHQRFVDGRFAAMSPAWVTCDLARRLPVAAALVMADGVARLHAQEGARNEPPSSLLTALDLAQASTTMTKWPGSRRARMIINLADPGAERAIETVGRLAFMDAGLPPSISNAWLRLESGRWRRVDHLWPWHGVVAEADGAIKYDNRPDASKIIADEKEREWELRELNLVVGRYTWNQAANRADQLGARMRKLLDDNPPRDRPVPYWVGLPGADRVATTPDMWPSPRPGGLILPIGARW